MSPLLHDLVVLSDLHLGRGKNSHTGRYFELEAFFYDDDLRRFCAYLCDDAVARGVDFKLIFNGDAFDLLRREAGADPSPSDASPSARERRYGAPMTPQRAAAELREILAGHPDFVVGVAHVLAAGYEVIFLPGNHDLEIQWPAVQHEIIAALRAHLCQRAGEEAADHALRRLSFRPWFYYEPDRVWIEHGCQYDPENAFRYLLRSDLDDGEASLVAYEEDMPLGNFFQRYLYNAFGHITFIVPSTRANGRYFKWLMVHQPRLLARVFVSHGRFWWQVMRRLAITAPEARRRLRDLHRAELDRLAEGSGLGERLYAIDALKVARGDIAQTVRALGWQILKDLLLVASLGLAVAGLWFAGFHAINQIASGFVLKAALFVLLNFCFVVAALVLIARSLLRAPPDPAARPLRRAARQIAQRLGAPIVTFGHTHEEVLWRLDLPEGRVAWYFNTGTWIAVFTHDVLLPRDRIQYTFLRVEGHEARLLHWSPGRGAALPVILLDEHEPEAPPERAA